MIRFALVLLFSKRIKFMSKQKSLSQSFQTSLKHCRACREEKKVFVTKAFLVVFIMKPSKGSLLFVMKLTLSSCSFMTWTLNATQHLPTKYLIFFSPTYASRTKWILLFSSRPTLNPHQTSYVDVIVVVQGSFSFFASTFMSVKRREKLICHSFPSTVDLIASVFLAPWKPCLVLWFNSKIN